MNARFSFPSFPASLRLSYKRTRFEDLDDRLVAWHLFHLGGRYYEAEMEAIYFGGPYGAKVFYSLN
ncbi:MAG: hypothetical protein K1X56_11150 [Flavobacteriales bacterium]|nr:hypothetical protein [Flavobacteriales bacterium]